MESRARAWGLAGLGDHPAGSGWVAGPPHPACEPSRLPGPRASLCPPSSQGVLRDLLSGESGPFAICPQQDGGPVVAPLPGASCGSSSGAHGRDWTPVPVPPAPPVLYALWRVFPGAAPPSLPSSVIAAPRGSQCLGVTWCPWSRQGLLGNSAQLWGRLRAGSVSQGLGSMRRRSFLLEGPAQGGDRRLRVTRGEWGAPWA